MKSNLRKTTKKGLAVVSAIVGLSALFAACSSSDEKGVAGGVSEDAGFVADVAGVAQKGPFVKGSAVTVRGVDCETLEFTDQVFEGVVKSDKGDFALDSIALDSSCAVIEVTGKYLNEVTGKKTEDELTLRTLTNLKDRENVNVNLLTSLAYERVMYLVKEKNKTLAKAKTQAESEVLAAFDIKEEIDEFENLNLFESGNGNAALLAVSVMMQGDADAAALAKRLDKFDDSFAESGEWKDSETKKAIAEWTAEAAANGELDSIRKNIEDMGYAGEVPAFEKYVPAVEPADSTEESSSSVAQDSIEEAISSSSKEEPRDSTVTSSSSEVKADTASSSSVMLPVSSSSRDSLDTLISSSSSIPDSLDSLRSSSSFVPDSLDSLLSSSSVADTSDGISRLDWNLPKSAYLNPNIKYDSIVDRRDGNVYKTVKIGNQVWMAENLNYAAKYSLCFDDDSAKCDVAGRVYTWAAAVDSIALAKDSIICGDGVFCELDSSVQGVCPAGWHLPRKAEWDTLFVAVGGRSVAAEMLKSQRGWYAGGNGTDSVGFSAIPVTMGSNENFGAYFWSVDEGGEVAAYSMYLLYNYSNAYLATLAKSNWRSVRCVKN